MAEETQAKPAPHIHECPVLGCHKRFACQGADCARFGYKNCADHLLAEVLAEASPPVVETPSDDRTPEQKIADAASYAEMEKRNLQLLEQKSKKAESAPEAPPAPEAPTEPSAPEAPPAES